MIRGVDYASGRPRASVLAAAGYKFCVRYLSPGGPALPGKLLTAVEYKTLTAAGIAVAVNWETTATRMKDGYPAGVVDAQAAVAAIRVIGYPPNRPIYFSADWDATPADQAEIDDYLRGAASVVGPDRVGVYGGYWVVKRCLDNMTARWAWQASAWSPTNPDGSRQVDPRAHLFQHVAAAVVDGVECDVNEALKPDYGQHPLATHRTGRKELTMELLPATAVPTDPNSDPLTWPQRNYDIYFDVAGGWYGAFAGSVGVQDWGNRTVDNTRGYLLIASWIMGSQGGALVPVDPVFTVKGGGRAISRHTPLAPFVAPAGAVGLSLNYAAPGGGGVAVGRSA